MATWQRQAIDHNGVPYVQLINQSEGLTPTSDLGDLLIATVNNRPSFAHTTVELKEGQQVVANAGTMITMEGHIPMRTWCHNGCATAWWRTCAKEHFCFNTFSGPGQVALTFENGLPGDILPFAVTPGAGWIVASNSFVCGTSNIKVSAKFGGCAMCLCGGEGAFLTHVTSESGKALFYAGSYGQIQRLEVPSGTTALIHTGLFFAAADNTNISAGMPGNCKSLCCSGEGFVLKIQGPSVVYTRNRDPWDMLKLLNPPPQPPQGGGGGDGGASAAGAM